MKTTIEIADAILRRAKAVADKESTTLRALVEEGLRAVLAKRSATQKRVELRPLVLKGRGLRPEAQGLSWQEVMDMANER